MADRMEIVLGLLLDRVGVRTREELCLKCSGLGVCTYASTATWRGGIGGWALTQDVCDKCWGSGNPLRPWPSWRALNLKADSAIIGKPVREPLPAPEGQTGTICTCRVDVRDLDCPFHGTEAAANRRIEADAEGHPNSGHGHVYPRPDGAKARCGGPALCSKCARDAAALARSTPAPTNEVQG